MVKQIIKEAMEQNPIGLKEAVAAELRERVSAAIENKISKLDERKETYSVSVNGKIGNRVGMSKENADDFVSKLKKNPKMKTVDIKIVKEDLDESYQQLSVLKDRIARRERKLKNLPDLHPDKKKLTIMIQKDKKKHQELSNKR